MIEEKIKAFAASFEDKISRIFEKNRKEYEIVAEAMKYSLSDGGKRLRPFLVEQFYTLCGGKKDAAQNFELAIECIHTYSLIHDDLPCMDDDDMRRGRPSCHKKFGEANALLAGDALLTYAFEIAANTEGIPAERVVKAIRLLAYYAGIDGMIGGQTVDLESESKKDIDIETVRLICSLKTGALLKASCLIGCTLAGADDQQLRAAEEYAENVGVAFQIMDDILDITGDEKKLGKPLHSDTDNEKSTFVSLLGIERCKAEVKLLTKRAKSALSIFGQDAKDLEELADYLCTRDY